MYVNRVSMTALFPMLLALSCATPTRVIHLSPEKHLNAISDPRPYRRIKSDYSVSLLKNWGPDQEERAKSIRMAREGINYEFLDRKMEITVTLWDLPLIKAFVKSQGVRLRSAAGEEMRAQFLTEFQQYTQLLLDVESQVEDFFDWKNWNIWMVDRDGRAYFPSRTAENSSEEIVLPVEKTILGQKTIRPGYKIYHDTGRLYFKRLDLAARSPMTLMFKSPKEKSPYQLSFTVKGGVHEQTIAYDQRDFGVSAPSPSVHPPLLEKSNGSAPSVSGNDLDIQEEKRRYFEQATDFFKDEQYEQAIKAWEKVLRLDPSHRLSRIKISKARERLDERNRKNQVLTQAQKRRNMGAHFMLATEYFQNGLYQEAIREWEKVLELDPTHELSKKKIEKAYERLGK